MTLLVGKSAPHFQAKAVINRQIVPDFSLQSFLGKYVVFFFYPLDFTFVCPTELLAFQEQLSAFEALNTQVIACSVDSHFTHDAWLNTPVSAGGISGVSYPLVSDLNKKIARDYGVLIEEDGIAYRGLFLIDRQGIVRHAVINDLPLGRSVDETLRTLKALQHVEKHGEVCPANWNQGKSSFKPTQEGLKTYVAHTLQPKKTSCCNH